MAGQEQPVDPLHHYCFIMLVELWLYTKGQLSNSLLDVVSSQLYGYPVTPDKPKDIVIKIAVALVSIGVSAVYALAHNAVKRRAKALPPRELRSPEARLQDAAPGKAGTKPKKKKP